MGIRTTEPLVVVQNNFVTRLTAPAAIAARGLGIALHDVSSGDMDGIPAYPGTGPWGPVLVIGSVLFVHQWARGSKELARWVFWDDDQYDAREWAERLGAAYLNSDGFETTVGEFASSGSEARHIRPRSGVKMVGDKIRTESATGQMSVPGLVATPEDVARLNIDPATRIWAAAPKEIVGEVRVWMIAGQTAAASTYRIDGEHDRRPEHQYVDEAVKAAAEWHGTWHPGRHYVVDVAITGDGPRIVEYNPIHSSGWYAADPAAVIQAYMGNEKECVQ